MNEELFTREGTKVDPSQIRGGYYVFVRRCGRCGGAGGSDRWAHTGYTCFDCGGKGTAGTGSAKVYTAEKLAKLNKTRDAIRAKKEAVRLAEVAEVAAERAAWEATNGNGELVARARALAERSEFLADLVAKLDRWLWSDKQIAAVRSAVEKIEARDAAHKAVVANSEWQGKVGDRLEADVIVTNVYSFNRPAFNAPWTTEACHIVTMTTNTGAVFVAKGSRFCPEKGARLRIKGTVKGHDTFKDVKQTVVNRVAIVASEESVAS